MKSHCCIINMIDWAIDYATIYLLWILGFAPLKLRESDAGTSSFGGDNPPSLLPSFPPAAGKRRAGRPDYPPRGGQATDDLLDNIFSKFCFEK